MMRILHTADTYSPSLDGVAEVVRHISEELAFRGHEVHVATRTWAAQPREAKLNQVHIHRFAARGNLATGMQGEIREYREFVNSGHWDIVVNHCLQIWTTDALLDGVGNFSWPSLLVSHGFSTWNPLFADYYRKVPFFISKFAGWVTISALNEEHAFAQQHGLLGPTIIQNGVDLSEWNQGSSDIRRKWQIGNRPWIINVSNHTPQKRHNWFFELAHELKDTDAKFALLGNPYLANKLHLGRFGIRGGCFYDCNVRALISRSVELKSSAPRQEVVSAISESDLVVSTSRWEANSVVLLECMAAGTPWVSTDVGSARENAGGIVVTSLEDMVRTVRELLHDAERRRRLGAEGRRRAAEKHDWIRIVDEYEKLYECTVGQRV